MGGISNFPSVSLLMAPISQKRASYLHFLFTLHVTYITHTLEFNIVFVLVFGGSLASAAAICTENLSPSSCAASLYKTEGLVSVYRWAPKSKDPVSIVSIIHSRGLQILAHGPDPGFGNTFPPSEQPYCSMEASLHFQAELVIGTLYIPECYGGRPQA